MDRTSYHPTFTSVWKETLVNYIQPFMAFFVPDILRDIAPTRGFERLDETLLEIAVEPERAWQELCDFEREIGRPNITDPEGVGHKAGWAEVRSDYLRQIETVLLYKYHDPGLALVPTVRQIQDVALLRKILVALDAGHGLEMLRRLSSER